METHTHIRTRHTILHPILLACAPTLIFYGQNREALSPGVILMPLTAGVILAVLSWILLKRITKDWVRSGIITSLGLFVFFSYGHFRRLIYPILEPIPYGVPLSIIVRMSWLLLVPVVAFQLSHSKRDLTNLSRVLNVTGLALVILPLTGLAIQIVGDSGIHTTLSDGNCAEPGIPDQRPGTPLPDIYYIILDGFVRDDVRKDVYHDKQSDLLDYLEGHGFYIARQSTANYCQTLLSLASSLNCSYIHGESIDVERPTRRGYLTNMIRDSRVGRILSCLGYRVVACASGYRPTEIRNANTFLDYSTNPWRYNDFHEALVQTTALPVILNRTNGLFGLHGIVERIRAQAHQERILYAYDVLSNLPKDPTATFAFVHIVAPHPPFVFDENGPKQVLDRTFDFSDGDHHHHFIREERQAYIEDYSKQLKFIEHQTIAALETILDVDGPSPIIIIQSDHGPGSGLHWESVDSSDVQERLGILNAYHLPNGGNTLLYDNITPVNTFRIILSHYFGMDLETLPDRSFFSRWTQPFDFVDVTERLSPAAD